MPERTANRYIKRHTKLRSKASSWRAHYRDLAQYMNPRRSRFEASDASRSGTKKNIAIVNNTATRGIRILASGLMAGITSPARPWFRLRVRDFELNKRKPVKKWLAEVERVILEAFARTNVYQGLASVYIDLATYGTSAMMIEEHPLEVMRVHVKPVGSYTLAMDDFLRVNTVYSKTTMTVEQLVRRFGIDNVSHQTKNLWDRKDYDEWMEVLHVLEPNDEVMHGNMDRTGMPIRSVWIDTGTSSASGSAASTGDSAQMILSEGGFQEFPILTPRWSVTGEDAYGNSPGMEAIGDVRALQHMEKRRAQALDKIVTPPMVAPALMRKTRISLLSGDVTYADVPANRQVMHPAYMVDPKIVLMGPELERHEARINSSFFVDLFLMLANSGMRQPITAREVQERHEEKMLQLGPTLERLQDELLDPLIDRAYQILFRRGMIPDPPPELDGVDARPEYISILAAAQKMLGIVAVERLVGFVQAMAEVNPEVVDKLDFDRVIDEVAELLGTNPDLVRTEDEVAEIRAQRQQRQAQAQEGAEQAKQAAEAAETMTRAGKNIDESPPGGAASQMMQMFGAGAQGGVPSA